MSYKIIKITIVKTLPFTGGPIIKVIYPEGVTDDIEAYRKEMKEEHGAYRVFLAYEEIKRRDRNR